MRPNDYRDHASNAAGAATSLKQTSLLLLVILISRFKPPPATLSLLSYRELCEFYLHIRPFVFHSTFDFNCGGARVRQRWTHKKMEQKGLMFHVFDWRD